MNGQTQPQQQPSQQQQQQQPPPAIDLSAGLVAAPSQSATKTAKPAAGGIDLSAGLVPASQASNQPAAPDPLTQNPKHEGTYAMQGSDGTLHDIPYSNVIAASDAGYRIKPADRERYAGDRIDEIRKQAAATGRQPTMNDLHAMKLPEPVAEQPGLWSRIRAGVAQATEPTSHYKGVVPIGQSGDPATAEAEANVIKRAAKFMFGAVDMPVQVVGLLQDLSSNDPAKSEAAEDQLQHLHPAVQVSDRGKEFIKDWKQDPKLAVENVGGDAAGFWLTGKATHAATEMAKEFPQAVADRVKSHLESVAGVRSAVGKAADEVAADQTAQAEKTTEEQQQARLKRLDDMKKQAADHLADVIDTADKNRQAALNHGDSAAEKVADAEQAHKDEVAKAEAENAKQAADHAHEVERVQQENAGAEQQLAVRQQAGQELSDHTAATEAKQKKIQAEAYENYNGLWNGLRAKTASTPVDVAPVVDTIHQQEARMTTSEQSVFRSILREGATAEQLDNIRANVIAHLPDGWMRVLPYDKLPEALRIVVDRDVENQAAVHGLDPDNLGEVSFGKLHSWLTELNYKKYFGPEVSGNVRQAVREVTNSLRQAENKTAKLAGAADDLDDARAETKRFKSAFGRPQPERLTVAEIALKKENPEQWEANKQRARVRAVAEYDPTIEDDYQRMADLRDKVKKLPGEEQLRKTLQQVPQPPIAKELPGPNQPGQPNPQTGQPLTPDEAKQLNLDHARQQAKVAAPPTPADIPQPEHAPPPAGKPVAGATSTNKTQLARPSAPEIDSIARIKIAAAKAWAQKWSQLNNWQLRGLAASGIGGLLSVMFPEHGESIRATSGVMAAANLSPLALSYLINKPRVLEWLGRATDADIATVSKITSSDQLRIKDALEQQMLEAARAGQQFHVSKPVQGWLGQAATKRIAQAVAAGGVAGVATEKQAVAADKQQADKRTRQQQASQAAADARRQAADARRQAEDREMGIQP